MAEASCTCGQVVLAASGSPIMTASCYCTSCRTAGRSFDASGAAPPIVDQDGGTSCVVYRKDRIRCTRGESLMEEHRLDPGSPTRRVLAKCCGTPMFADFTKGHWLTVYRGRFAIEPPVEMRVMTGDRESTEPFADDVPSSAGHSGKFMIRLLIAWLAMGFRRPGFPPR